ncbi:Uma2 family endonuclease [Deinococcus radiophilus]|uniref:Uma2 family endonuclease n=1 Tax=Deinococcus radiophilus TaxID=32062 RepID=UPI00360EF902
MWWDAVAARNDDYTETEPCFIAEVLSESTRMADQNSKAERHRELPSLQAYFLVRRGYLSGAEEAKAGALKW